MGSRNDSSEGGRIRAMTDRLNRIVTRTGDDGTTGLGDGSRVGKDALRVEVMGNLDELNSAIGAVLAEHFPRRPDDRNELSDQVSLR